MKMKKTITLLLCCVVLMGLLISGRKPKAVSEKPLVYTTIEPLRFFAEQIAGDHFQIVTLVPQGSSPETYDPTPQQLVELAESQAYLAVGGLGFENQWLGKLAENAPKVRFCNTSEGLQLLQNEHQHEGEGAVEPHIWTSPSNALVMARNICNLFCEMDPEHREEYVQNLTGLGTLIQQTDAEIRTIHEQGMQPAFAIYHPTLTYFANDYGLTQLCIEQDGKEPSPARLKDLIEQCRTLGVKVMFIQQEFNTHNAEIIAQEIGAQLVTINPLSYNWQEEMVRIANTLKK